MSNLGERKPQTTTPKYVHCTIQPLSAFGRPSSSNITWSLHNKTLSSTAVFKRTSRTWLHCAYPASESVSICRAKLTQEQGSQPAMHGLLLSEWVVPGCIPCFWIRFNLQSKPDSRAGYSQPATHALLISEPVIPGCIPWSPYAPEFVSMYSRSSRQFQCDSTHTFHARSLNTKPSYKCF